MSTKTVKFRRESPSGGPYLDHQRSDSGVGSFSDNDSRGPYGDRYSGSDYEFSLQEALNSEQAAKKEWMKKAADLDAMLIRAHKDIKETEARMRALEDHVEELTDEKTKLQKTNKELTDENAKLRDELNKDTKKDKDKRADRTSRKDSSPLMSGANPLASEKPKRSSSKHRTRESARTEREKDTKDRERIAKELAKEMERENERDTRRDTQREGQREMDRLRKRFDARERGEESDATGKSSNSSGKSHRGRRDSYVEPLGQPAPRPAPHSQVPPSPSTRGGFAYGSGAYPPQQHYGQPSSAPRVVHPQVVVSYSDNSYDDEDGLYHAHPLPKQPRSQERRGAR